MSLTLAIPVRDDEAGLIRLLTQAAALPGIAGAVVVDDGSAVPLEAARLCGETGLDRSALTLLRLDGAGPGTARNRALPHIETNFTLYMDADDLLTAELPCLLADLDGQEFDFCQFRHHDTRAARDMRWGPMRWDMAHWRAAGLELGALRPVGARAAACLAQTANYPWNKLYRTAFLRDRAVRCAEIRLHEDVELHWLSFLRADRILASDRVCVVHEVSDTGQRMTNARSPERLRVFDSFSRLAAEFAQGPQDAPLQLGFYRFALGLCAWIADNLEPADHPELQHRVHRFAQEEMPAGLLARLRDQDPDLLARAGI